MKATRILSGTTMPVRKAILIPKGNLGHGFHCWNKCLQAGHNPAKFVRQRRYNISWKVHRKTPFGFLAWMSVFWMSCQAGRGMLEVVLEAAGDFLSQNDEKALGHAWLSRSPQRVEECIRVSLPFGVTPVYELVGLPRAEGKMLLRESGLKAMSDDLLERAVERFAGLPNRLRRWRPPYFRSPKRS